MVWRSCLLVYYYCLHRFSLHVVAVLTIEFVVYYSLSLSTFFAAAVSSIRFQQRSLAQYHVLNKIELLIDILMIRFSLFFLITRVLMIIIAVFIEFLGERADMNLSGGAISGGIINRTAARIVVHMRPLDSERILTEAHVKVEYLKLLFPFLPRARRLRARRRGGRGSIVVVRLAMLFARWFTLALVHLGRVEDIGGR